MGRVRVARIHCGVKPLDRISRLLALRLPELRSPACLELDYLLKPPSNWANTSRRTQLYGRSHTGGKSRSFLSVGCQGTPVVTCLQSSRACGPLRSWLVATTSEPTRCAVLDSRDRRSFPCHCVLRFIMNRIGNRMVGNSATKPSEMIRQKLSTSGIAKRPLRILVTRSQKWRGRGNRIPFEALLLFGR